MIIKIYQTLIIWYLIKTIKAFENGKHHNKKDRISK